MPQFDSPHLLKTYSRRKQIVIPSTKVFDDVVRRDHPSLIAFDCTKQMHLEFNVEKRKRRFEGECSDSKSESTPFLFGDGLSERTQQDDKKVCSDDKTQQNHGSRGSIQNSSFDLRRRAYISLNAFSSKDLFVDEGSDIALQDEALQVHPEAFVDKVKSLNCKKLKMQLIENSSCLQDDTDSTLKALKSASRDKLAGKKTSEKTNSLAFSKQAGIRPKRLQKVDSRHFTEGAVLNCKAVESLNHSKYNSVKHLDTSYLSFKEAACHDGNSRKRKITFDEHGQLLNSTFTGNSDAERNTAEDADEVERAWSIKKNSCTVTKISPLKNVSVLESIDSVALDAKAKTFVDKFTQMFGTKLPFTSKSSSKTALHTSASLEVSEDSRILLPVSKTRQFASTDSAVLLDSKMLLQFNQNNFASFNLSPRFEDCNDTTSLVDEVTSCSVDEEAGESLRISRLFDGKASGIDMPVASKDKANTNAILSQESVKADEDTDDDCSVLLLSPLPTSPVEGPAFNLLTEKLQRRNDLSDISSGHSYDNHPIHESPKDKDAECSTTKGSSNRRNKSESKKRHTVDDDDNDDDDDEGFEELDKASSQTKCVAENTLNEKFQVFSEPSVVLKSKFLKSACSTLSFRSRSSQQRIAEDSLKNDLSSVSEQQVKTEINLKPPSDSKITLECGVKPENNDLGNCGKNICRDESSRRSDQKEISSDVLDEQLLGSGENKCEWSVPKYCSGPSASVDVESEHSFQLCNRPYVAKEQSSNDSKTIDNNVCKRIRSRSGVEMVKSVSTNNSYKKAGEKTEKFKEEEKHISKCNEVKGKRSDGKQYKREEVKNSPKLILNASSKSETDKAVGLNEADSFAIPKEHLQMTEAPGTSTKPESRFRSKTEIAKELIGEQRSAPDHFTSPQPCSNERRLLKSADKTSNKAKALYNPRQWHGSDEAESCTEMSTKPRKTRLTKAVGIVESFDFSTSDYSSPVMTRVSSFPGRLQGSDIVKIRVAREDKPLFTVVHNVKEAHECQEYGETQEFHDDVDYILDGLQSSQPLATRCLSTLSLASKCLGPAFRMHLRAHGIIPKIFEALHDTSDSMPLSLCLSALLFMMSCDRLTIELDDVSLKLVLSLLDVNSESNAVVGGCENSDRTRMKVLELCRAAVNSGRISFLDLRLQDMTTKFLGIEVLLSLASKLTVDWFKRSLRTDGGLRHILDAVCQSAEEFERLSVELSDVHLCLCSRATKCLKVLDNVTYLCPENQLFVVGYRSKAFMVACHRLLTSSIQHLKRLGRRKSAANEMIDRDSRCLMMSSVVLSILRVLLNVTHENEDGCRAVGQSKGLVLTVLTAVVHASDIASPCQQFDLSILGLSLLLNLTENCESNREILYKLRVETPPDVAAQEKVTALESLGILFSQRYSAARLIEEVHDAKLEASEKRQQQQQQLFDGGSASDEYSAGATGDVTGHWVECESGLQWIDLAPSTFRPPSVSSDESALSSQDDADNYTRDLHTAGRHMEDSIVAAYIALVIGSIVQEEKRLAEGFRQRLPQFSFIPLVRMLRKFLGFMNFANVSNANGCGFNFHHILEILESL